MGSREIFKSDGTITRVIIVPSKWEALGYSTQAEGLACVKSPETSCNRDKGENVGPLMKGVAREPELGILGCRYFLSERKSILIIEREH